MFGKIKSAAKKIVSKVKSAFSGAKTGSSFASAITSLSSTSNAAQRQTIAPNISTPQGIGRANPNGSITLLGSTGQPTNKVITSSGAGSTIAPSTITGASPIYSAPTTLRGGQTSTSTMSLAPTSEDTVISSESMGGSSSFSSEGGSMSSSPSISVPSAPTYADVGQINNGGLIASLADSYTYDPEKNMFSPVTTTGQPQNTEVDKRTKLQDMLQKLIPKKDSLYEDPLIRQQNEEINRRKQEVNNYTSQLNSVVAQQNADLLRLRGIGSQEGVTETVYGGQAATINREAAIKALPIQAQIAASQGNLELAQDYLTQLTTWKQEQVDNEYSYKTALYSSIKDFVDGEEKIRLNELEKQNDRAYKESQNLIDKQDYWTRWAMENGQQAQIPRITNTRSEQELAGVVSRMAPRGGSGAGGVYDSFEEQIQDLKLSTGQKGELVDIQTLNEQIGTLENLAADGILEGIGGLGVGSAKQLAFKTFGKGSSEGAQVRTTIGNIKGTIAKLRGGTSFTANEEKLLDSYVPGINESMASVMAKLRGLKSFLKSKQDAIVRVGGGTVQAADNDPLKIR